MTEPTPTLRPDIRLDDSLTEAEIFAAANAENHLFIAKDTKAIIYVTSEGYKKRLLPVTKETRNPTVNDDSSTGHIAMETWLNTANGAYFLCRDDTPGAAQWDYLLGGSVSETLNGTVDGINTTFTIPSGAVANDFGLVFWNGRHATTNYTITGDTVEFSVAPALDTELWFVGNLQFTGGVEVKKAQNNILVSTSGGDYTSLKDAVDSIPASGQQWNIDIGPGVYAEAGPIQGKENLSINALGGLQTVTILNTTPNANLFDAVTGFSVKGLTITGVTGTGYAFAHEVAGFSAMSECVMTECSNGVYINHATANVSLNLLNFINGAVPANDGVLLENGVCTIDRITSVTGAMGALVHATGAGSQIQIRSATSLNPLLDKCFYIRDGCGCTIRGISVTGSIDGIVADGGAIVKVTGGQITNCTQDGLRISDVGANTDVTVQSIDIAGSTRWDLNLASTTSILSGSGKISSDMTYRAPGARIVMQAITLKEDDEGVDNYGEFHNGTPESPAEFVSGGGDSYSRGMLVYTYNGVDYVDVSTAARSASSSTFTFPGVTAGNSILIASSLKNDVDFLEHYGLKTKIATAGVVGTGEIVLKYWNGSTWSEVNGFEVDEATGRYPHAKDYFSRTGSAQLRYNPLLAVDSWSKSDPMELGEDYYWIKIEIVTDITTAPIFEQFKLHTCRFEANSDGWVEFMGTARPIGQLPIDFSSASPIAGNMQSQSLWMNENVGVGFTSNKFTTTSGITGIQGFLPYDCDTSAPLKVFWSGSSSVSETMEFTVRMGKTTDGDPVFTTNPGLSPGLIVATVQKAVTLNTDAFFELDLDISNVISRRENGFGDKIWISLQPTTMSGNFSLSGSQITYTRWCKGGHI
jgi:hypothetical protein